MEKRLISADSIDFGYSSEHKVKIFQNESLSVEENEVVVIVGESGSGKSTLLKVMAGLLVPEAGTIIGRCSTKGSFVFQSPVLLDWLNVAENIVFPEKLSKSNTKELTNLLNNVELGWAKEKFPRELSGGMRSRVQMARVLYRKSKVLFLDEAFSALDEKLRLKMNMFFKKMRNLYRFSALVVSHLVEEAVFLADRIWFIQRKSPSEPAIIREFNEGLTFSNKSMDILESEVFHRQVSNIKKKIFSEYEVKK